jgi:hypothetical protein
MILHDDPFNRYDWGGFWRICKQTCKHPDQLITDTTKDENDPKMNKTKIKKNRIKGGIKKEGENNPINPYSKYPFYNPMYSPYRKRKGKENHGYNIIVNLSSQSDYQDQTYPADKRQGHQGQQRGSFMIWSKSRGNIPVILADFVTGKTGSQGDGTAK